jgi:hypothetical protein
LISAFGGVLGSIFLIGIIFHLAFGLLHAVVWMVGAVAWIFLMIRAYMSPETYIR